MAAAEIGGYPFQGSDAELRRLARQAPSPAELTEDVLRRAGLARGMRVLDIGSGDGDAGLLAARLVGPAGAVFGIDRAPEAVSHANARATAEGLSWCRFDVADADDFESDERFDAVIGRLVLVCFPDPAATLRRLVRHLRPGGIVAFQEFHIGAARAIPEKPVVAQCAAWLTEILRRAATDADMGRKLFGTFVAADLQAPDMLRAIQVVGGPEPLGYDTLAETLGTVLPARGRLGVATAVELYIDALEERLRQQAEDGGQLYVFAPLVSAWSRVPD